MVREVEICTIRCTRGFGPVGTMGTCTQTEINQGSENLTPPCPTPRGMTTIFPCFAF